MRKQSYEIIRIDETTREVRYPVKGMPWVTEHFRVYLQNRTHDRPDLSAARPGIGGNYNTSVRWFMVMPLKWATERGLADKLVTCAGRPDWPLEELAAAVYECRRQLKRENAEYLKR